MNENSIAFRLMKEHLIQVYEILEQAKDGNLSGIENELELLKPVSLSDDSNSRRFQYSFQFDKRLYREAENAQS